VDALQNVGQNKHLKLRLSKGTTQLDGIFFSANTETCGVGVGDRVDALFYLNLNTFRSRCTVQMQLVDIRLSLEPSVRERDDLEKFSRFLSGGDVTAQEAVHLLPERAQFAACWRWLDRHLPAQGDWQAPFLPLLRSIERNLGGMDPFSRSMVCLAVFCERGLLEMEGDGDERILRRVPIEGKAELNASPYMQLLQKLSQRRR
jgi:single-stranded-DNA-specific exonuclease